MQSRTMCPVPACDQVFECGSVFNSGAVLTKGTEKLAVGESTLHTGCASSAASGASENECDQSHSLGSSGILPRAPSVNPGDRQNVTKCRWDQA